jgi:predicted RNA-binding Zn-ribbon protein involved in translation (DUF1610 family)
MDRQAEHLELRCPNCRWSEFCGRMEMANWLRKARKLTARSRMETEVMIEVFRATAASLACPSCGQVGLAAVSADAPFDWPELKRCGVCSQPIGQERLEAVPDATLCAACQRNEEQGRPPSVTDYCPRCGAPMMLRPSRTAGVTRYVPTCTGNPPCRGD